MSKSTEEKLGHLHGAVAQVLTWNVLNQEAVIEYDADGEATVTDKMEYTCTPAMMAASIKFLKDNAVVCDLDQQENMNNLKDIMEKKQKHSRMVSPKEAVKLTIAN